MSILRFNSLVQIPNLFHALTTREGGVSSGGFDSLNLAFHVGDNAGSVRENRQILAREMGFDLQKLGRATSSWRRDSSRRAP